MIDNRELLLAAQGLKYHVPLFDKKRKPCGGALGSIGGTTLQGQFIPCIAYHIWRCIKLKGHILEQKEHFSITVANSWEARAPSPAFPVPTALHFSYDWLMFSEFVSLQKQTV